VKSLERLAARTIPNVSDELRKLFERDCERFIAELEQFESETALWTAVAGVSNAAGNLALHIVGNLNQYIGAELGGTDFLRDRDAEFASRDIPRHDLIAQLRRTKTMVNSVLGTLDPARLEQIHPEEKLGYAMTTRHFLIHLYGHLNYHLGQVNYLRRVLHG
jgi:uncharacterized damage-inducible protein DinB